MMRGTIATVGAIEIMRCMCGKHTCKHCGGTAPAHPGIDQLACPHCGYPLHSVCLNPRDTPHKEG